MGNPWIFDETFEDLSPEDQFDYQTRVINRHMSLIQEHFPNGLGLIQMQRHLSWYSGGRERARSFRVELFGTNTYEEARDVFDRYWETIDPRRADRPEPALA